MYAFAAYLAPLASQTGRQVPTTDATEPPNGQPVLLSRNLPVKVTGKPASKDEDAADGPQQNMKRAQAPNAAPR